MCVAPPEFLLASVVAPAFQSLMSVFAIVNPVSSELPSVASTKYPSGISCDAVLNLSGIAIIVLEAAAAGACHTSGTGESVRAGQPGDRFIDRCPVQRRTIAGRIPMRATMGRSHAQLCVEDRPTV